jgi:hypothetical protein
MLMTPAQLATLKADILADPAFAQVPLNSDGAFAIAAAYNLQASPDFTVWRTSVPVSEISGNGFVWTAVDALAVGKARIWEWMKEGGSINPSKANVRQGLVDAFGATQPNIAPVLKRLATRVEKLFSTGTGTVGSPGTMSFEGTVSYQDVEAARNS